MSWNRRRWNFLAAFVLIESAAVGRLYYNWQDKETRFLDQYSTSLQVTYRSSTNMYRLMTQAIVNEAVNRPEVLDHMARMPALDEAGRAPLRGHLYQLLLPTYAKLKAANVRQFHLHLPNGESLLRFHDPPSLATCCSTPARRCASPTSSGWRWRGSRPASSSPAFATCTRCSARAGTWAAWR